MSDSYKKSESFKGPYDDPKEAWADWTRRIMSAFGL